MDSSAHAYPRRSTFARASERQGFTLVEIIVVILILGILAAFAVPSLVGYIDKVRKETASLEAREFIKHSTALVAQQHGAWRPAWESGRTMFEPGKIYQGESHGSFHWRHPTYRALYVYYEERQSEDKKANVDYFSQLTGYRSNAKKVWWNGSTFTTARFYNLIIVNKDSSIVAATYMNEEYLVTWNVKPRDGWDFGNTAGNLKQLGGKDGENTILESDIGDYGYVAYTRQGKSNAFK